jgi:hypothetical protein
LDEALAELERARGSITGGGQSDAWRAIALAETGVVHTARGSLERGFAAFEEAERLLGRWPRWPGLAVIRARHAACAARGGDVDLARSLLARAEDSRSAMSLGPTAPLSRAIAEAQAEIARVSGTST